MPSKRQRPDGELDLYTAGPSNYKKAKLDRPSSKTLAVAADQQLLDEQQQARYKQHPLYDAIEALAKKTPRFLFRVWDKRSGGNPILNTPKAITPHFFTDSNNAGASIYDFSKHQIAKIAEHHLCNRWIETFFSSWTPSLSTALNIATRKDERSCYIAMLDTQMLGPENVMLYSPALSFLGKNVPLGFRDESLAFGVIPGSAYCSIEFRILRCRGLLELWKESPQSHYVHLRLGPRRSAPIGEATRIATQCSWLFPERISIPVIFSILTLCGRTEHAMELVEFLASLEINGSVKYDDTEAIEMIGGWLPDATRFMSTLQHVIRSVQKMDRERSEEEEEEINDGDSEESQLDEAEEDEMEIDQAEDGSMEVDELEVSEQARGKRGNDRKKRNAKKREKPNGGGGIRKSRRQKGKKPVDHAKQMQKLLDAIKYHG